MFLSLIVVVVSMGIFFYLIIKAKKQNKNRFLWIIGASVGGVIAFAIVIPTLFWSTMPLWSHKTVTEMPLSRLESKAVVVLGPGYYGITVGRDTLGTMDDEKGDVYYLLTIPSENIHIENTAPINLTMGIAYNNRERFTLKRRTEAVLTAKMLTDFKSKINVKIVRNPYP